MQHRISCLGCGRGIEVTPADAGHSIVCRACGTKFLVPQTVAALPAAQPNYPTPKPPQPVAAPPAPAPHPHLHAHTPGAAEAPAPAAGFLHPTRFVAFAVGAAIVLALTGGIWLGSLLHRPSSGETSAETGSVAPPPPAVQIPATRPAELLQLQFQPALQLREEAAAHAAAGRLEEARATYRAFLLVASQFRDLPEARVAVADATSELARIDSMIQSRPIEAPPAPPPTPPEAIASPPAEPAPPQAGTPAPTAPSVAQGASAAAPSTAPTAAASQPFDPEPPMRAAPIIGLAPRENAAEDLDAKIDASIYRGVNYLLTQLDFPPNALQDKQLTFKAADLNATLDKVRTDKNLYGPFVLTVYALAAAGQATNNPQLKPQAPLMAPLLGTLRSLNLAGHAHETYIRALRAATLALCDRAEDRPALKIDVNTLVEAGRKNGSHEYRCANPSGSRGRVMSLGGDNSNSQFGTMGVWSGAEAGIEVPDAYWAAVERHWQGCLDTDGGWSYRQSTASSTLSMTAAGVVSLYITYDYLHAAEAVRVFKPDPMGKALRSGIAWLETGDRSVTPRGHRGYELFALERVGLATGFKYFGTHDWYRELARIVMATQGGDGGWGKGPAGVQETAFDVLFLSRGRHPILMNKLEFDGNWCNRPRDVSSAARFVSKNLEQPLNWQVVNASIEGGDLLESPILYIASEQPPKLTDREMKAIRDFILGGGTVLLQPDGQKEAFKSWAVDFCKKICPPYALEDLPPTHDLLNVPHRIDPDKIHLKAASNGVRPLVILVQEDVGAGWQVRSDKTQKESFQLATNLFVFTTGKEVPRRRLQSPALTKVEGAIAGTLRVTRISYAGNWDPEPGAWSRFARLFYRETSAAIDVTEIPAAKLSPGSAALAHLTGTAAQVFTPEETKAIHDYVDAGGVLLIDAAGGYNAFADSVRDKLLPQAFPDLKLQYAESTDPPLVGGQPEVADDLHKLNVEMYVSEKRAGRSTRLQVGRCSKGWVIFSPMDITHGLLGMHTWGVMGYTPETCKGIVKNILVWAGTMRENSPTPQ